VAPPNIKSGTYSASGMVEIDPSDTEDLAHPLRGLYVGGGGDVRCVGPEGDVVTLKNLSSGQILPVQIVRVYASGTTATDLVGLY
jgi:hypothetical protein